MFVNFTTDYDTIHSEPLIGEVLTLDDQCELTFGTGAVFCGVNIFH